ncbi:hypothetical protein C8R48DRAFT_669394 [Suillus tomentosus]|nr:hypothetical protein C8R48DRAFT_669394 [Suillus tomentosus]
MAFKPFLRVLLPDFWITFYYYYPCTMAVQFDALLRQRCALTSIVTHASGDLDDDAWVVHRGEKDSYAHVRVSGQWVIKALQHNKLSNIGPSPRDLLVGFGVTTLASQGTWFALFTSGRMTYIIGMLSQTHYRLNLHVTYDAKNMRWTRGRGEDRASELREQNKDFDE